MIINVVDDRGRVLPTDEFGRYLLAPNYPLQQDDIGRFIGPDGQPLSTDNSGNYVYQDKTKYSSKIDNDFGRPLPTDENGFYVGKDGSMITTELTSFPMDEQGVILPTDESGIFMITKFPTQTKSYQILDEKHQIMPTDEAGNFLDHDGYPIAENEDGKPVYADGVVLPTTDIGYYVFDSARLKSIISTRKSMEDIYSIEGKLLPADEDGQLITKEETRPGEKSDCQRLAVDIRGHLIPTNSAGRPLDEDGVILPIDSKGNVVYANERKKCDTHIGVMDIAVAINVETLNYDSFEHVKRVILNLVDEHFDLAPDMTQFAVIKYSGTAEIPITLEHPRLAVGINAAKQQFISFGRENVGRLMIVITDGQDISEKSENFDGSSPAADELGRVLSIQTSKQIVSATDEYGHVIYPIKDIITDSTRGYADFQESSLLYPVIGPDNILSSKDISDVLRSENKLLATARNDLSLMPDASVGGANFHRRPLYSLGDEVLPSDEYNRIYFKSPNGELSSTTETGNFITNQNKPLSIEIDRNGKEIGAKVGPDQILKRQKSIVVDLSERSLSTNRYGDSIYADSGVVPTDASSPIGQNESLMSVDRGQYVSNYMPDRIGLQESELLTDACDKIEESANVILMIESSDSTRTKLNKIKISLLNFIEKNINWRIVKVGIVTYGSTVNVNMDIGNYQNYDDLKESILSLPFIGGTASGDEHAFRTALQLFREKYDNDSGELIVHIFKNPLSKDAQVIASRLKVNESISILSLGPDQWYRLDSDKEIKKLRSELKNKMRSGDGSMIPSESEMADKSLSKDENGHYAQSIAGQDSLFVTDSSGYPIDSFGRFIHHDTVGIPIIPDDRSLSKNDQNRRYTYPTNEINDISLSTDVNRELKYPEQRGKVLPVDTDDHTVYPVIGLKRDPLPTVNSGLNRKTTPIDKYGRLIGVDRLSFKTDSSIKFLLDTESNKNGHIKYSGVDQISSPTSNSEILLDLSGKPIATGDIAKPLGPDGEVLPMNEYGIYIYPNAGQDGKIFRQRS
ncbi:BMA-DIG-1, isoform e [Dirofilaria immitis]|nr:BMA-DIG-1, isoform e [Dirofilaria immitis]